MLGQVAISIFIAEALRSRIVYGSDSNYVVGDHGFGAKFLKVCLSPHRYSGHTAPPQEPY